MGEMSVIRALTAGLALAMVGIALGAPGDRGNPPGEDSRKREAVATGSLPTVDEARGRAALLHETIHATLQFVHAQYYREDEGLLLPAATLKSVFRELAERRKVELRWLVVEGRAMNIDHNPRDEFEKQAVKALGSGKDEFELAEDGVYRYAAPITLGSECLKCHLPNRTSNASRAAGLVISMPVEMR
jgi:hypothetical protein